MNFFAYREKVCGETFAELRVNFTGVLINTLVYQIDMFKLHRSDGAVSCTCKKSKCHQRPISFFNLGLDWHCLNNVRDLL